MEAITSKQNPLCTHMRRLASTRSYREEKREFFCDSPKLLDEALRWGAEIVAVLYTADVTLPALPATVRAAEVTEAVMKSVSPMEAPQGVVFSCRMRDNTPPKTLEGSRYLVLDGVQDPGNVGTILRTADAFCADGVFLVNGCADLYNPKTVRATMGAVFRCPVWTCGAKELRGLLTASGLPLYGAALRSDTLDARSVDYSRCAIAIGSEGKGLCEEMLSICDKTILIPMSGHCESLNAAIAASVLLWEVHRND